MKTGPFAGDPLVSVRNLRVSFRLDRHTTFEAVKGISFDIPRDSTVALVGESGSGKSVTSLAMLGLLPPENSIVDPSPRNLGRERCRGASRRIPTRWDSGRVPAGIL